MNGASLLWERKRKTLRVVLLSKSHKTSCVFLICYWVSMYMRMMTALGDPRQIEKCTLCSPINVTNKAPGNITLF